MYLENQLLNSKKSIARKISAIKNFYKYLKLINDFRERVFNHSLLTLAVLIGSSRFSLSADLLS